MKYTDYEILYSEGNNLIEVTKHLSEKITKSLSDGWSLHGELIVKQYSPYKPHGMEAISNEQYVLFQAIVK